jgi:hypothetical protein
LFLGSLKFKEVLIPIKKIYTLFLGIMMLVVVSATAMARPITFVDFGEQCVLSKEIDSGDDWALEADVPLGKDFLSIWELSLSGAQVDTHSLGIYNVISENFLIGVQRKDYDDNNSIEDMLDIRARTHVDDNLTLAAKLDWTKFDNENSVYHEISLTAQAECLLGNFLLFNGGVLTTDNNISGTYASNTYLVAGAEVAFRETEKARGTLFVDYRIPIDNKDEDNTVTFGIAVYKLD